MAKNKSDDLDREFTAEVYRAAAEEHLNSLDNLYIRGSYALALYVAGLAVESIFRAFRCRIDTSFDSRHNLNELAKAARFIEQVPAGQVSEYLIAMGEVVTRWSNNHRFRSNAAARAFLRRARLNRGVRGDYLKENVRLTIEFASIIVNIGISQWKP